MTDIPQEWVEAGARAIIGEEATSTTGYYGASYRVDSEHAPDLAREALAAVAPLIRAAVAEEIAAELDRLAGVAFEARESLAMFGAARVARRIGGTP